MASRQNSEHSAHSEDERDHYDYNNGIPPYEGATWDEEINAWVSNPFDTDMYDEEGNYRILPEDIVVEPTPAPAAVAQPQESRKDKMKRLMRERRERERAPVSVVAVPPTPPTEDPRIVEARIGLPAPWEAHISNTYNIVYYFDPRNGNKQWDKPTMGGKRTRRRRPTSKSRARQSKRKRTTTRRKRTTTTTRRR